MSRRATTRIGTPSGRSPWSRRRRWRAAGRSGARRCARGDAGVSNAPPLGAGPPPRQFGALRRDDDKRWTRRAQPAPPVTGPISPAAAVERERRREEPGRRVEPRVERARPAQLQPAPATRSPVAPVAETPVQPAAVAAQPPRERPERRAEPRPAIVPGTPQATPVQPPTARVPAPARRAPPRIRTPGPFQAPPPQVRAPAPVEPPAPVQPAPPVQVLPSHGRTPGSVHTASPVHGAMPPQVRAPAPVQAAAPRIHAPALTAPPQIQPPARPDGNRGQPRVAQRGERRGG